MFRALTVDEAVVEVGAGQRLVVVDFTARWCGPCKQMDRSTWPDPTVQRWLERHAVALQVDVDADEATARRFDIRAMPTVVVLRQGRELDRSVGAKSPHSLLAWLEGLRGGRTELDGLLTAHDDDVHGRFALAKGLLDRGRPEEAWPHLEWLWLHALEVEPAWVGVRHSFLAGVLEEAAEVSPRIRQGLSAIRDASSPRVCGGKLFHDWLTLNTVLGEPQRTLAWFDEVKHAPPPWANLKDRFEVVQLLRTEQRWADLGGILDDAAGLFQANASHFVDGLEELAPEAREELEPYLRTSQREEARDLRRALLAAGKLAEAAALTACALAVDGSPQMRTALAEAGPLEPAVTLSGA